MPGIFDITRIQDHPDKELLERLKIYYQPFVNGDAQGLADQQSEDYIVTDIPLSVVRWTKQQLLETNKGFMPMTTDTVVKAISLYGSCAPGQFAIMENAIWFTLLAPPPPGVDVNFPPGTKAGDRVGMIMLSALWWNEDGKVFKELQSGRLTWEGFDINEFT